MKLMKSGNKFPTLVSLAIFINNIIMKRGLISNKKNLT